MKVRKYFLIFFSSFIFMFTNPLMSIADTKPLNSENQMLVARLDNKSKKKSKSENKLSEPIDKWYTEKFVFPGLYKYGIFESSLEKRLINNQKLSALTKELEYNLLYDTGLSKERQELIDERDNLVMRGLLSLFGDVFKDTPIGKKYTEIERRISAFLKMGFIKGVGEKGKFYSFGQLDPDKLDEKRDIELSLSGFFYTDKFLEEKNYSAVLDFVFYKNNTKAIYDFSKKELGISLTNDEANSYLGKDAKISLFANKRIDNDEKQIGTQLSFIF